MPSAIIIKLYKFVMILLAVSLVRPVIAQNLSFEFYDGTIHFELDQSSNIGFASEVSQESVESFYTKLNESKYQTLLNSLLEYRKKYELNDWIYYQLIRKTAQQISPKEGNYHRYTLYKWFLLAKSGYDARLAISKNNLLFYTQSDDEVYDLPFIKIDGKQYVCLNFHDFNNLNYRTDGIKLISISLPETLNKFSYKITRMPDLPMEKYVEKTINFRYDFKDYDFKIQVNSEIESIFKNYPIVEYETYFNIPLSSVMYASIIPALKKNISEMGQKKGIDFLMRFTRNAMLYERDEQNFGKEKRLSPEQTLLSNYSDCDDRVALFFYLVKEIYNLPMIAILYPTHISIAINLDKPVGKTIMHEGKKYSICEPTPQKDDLKIGQISNTLKSTAFTIAYNYLPKESQ